MPVSVTCRPLVLFCLALGFGCTGSMSANDEDSGARPSRDGGSADRDGGARDVDGDGDGHPASVDCDDGNEGIHPGAEDVCGDGIDQDCSGADSVCLSDEFEDSRAGDEQALQDLYVATNGDGWNNDGGWSASGMSLSDGIHGVTVETVGGELRVTEIDLRNNNLSGDIEVASIGNLQEMRLFAVTFNQLDSSIPPELGNCTALEYLYLCRANPYDNDLYPHEQAQMPGDGDVHTGKNKGDERNVWRGNIPSTLGNLVSLKWLVLNWTDSAMGVADGISSVPDELFGIPAIEGLQIFNNNNLAERPFPAGITAMSDLDNLALGGEKSGREAGFLTGSVPPAFGALSKLRHVRFNRNRDLILDFDVVDFSGMTSLVNFTAPVVGVRGEVPPELLDGTLPDLLGFNLGFPAGDGMTGSLSSGGNGVNIINIRGNRVGGAIPSSFWSENRSIILLDLVDNDLTSIGTTNLRTLRRPRNLRFAGNDLSGPWPELDWTNRSEESRHPLRNFSRAEFRGNRYVFADMLVESDDGRTLFDWYREQAENLFNYAPQQKFGSSADVSGSTIDFSETVTHPDNAYRWYRNGSLISGETSSSIDTSSHGSGTYRLEVTNPGVPDLTLESVDIEI